MYDGWRASWFFHDGGPYYTETSPLICCKSMDWFLYDRDIRHERVNARVNAYIHWDIFLGYDKTIDIYASNYPRSMLLINTLNKNQTFETLNARKTYKAYIELGIFSLYFITVICKIFIFLQLIIGTLMQNWKSVNIFVYTWKLCVEGFTLKHLIRSEICARETCEKFVYKHLEAIEHVKD